MDKNKIPVRTHYLVKENYLMTRAAALQFPAKQFAGMIPNDDTVYGVVVDLPVNPVEVQTVVCYINGAANLYFNNGTSYTGASQRYQTVVQASRLLVLNASSLIKDAKATKSYPLPTNQVQNVYLLTKRGVYCLNYLAATIKEESTELQIFHGLLQRLQVELRSAMLKDRAAKR